MEDNLLPNGSFELSNWGHTDETQRQQVPEFWWLEVDTDGDVHGRPIYTTPEAVHKNHATLPEDEWDWLIYDGQQCFKVFAEGTWRTRMGTWFIGTPGEEYVVRIHANVHFDGRGETYDGTDAEIYLHANDQYSVFRMRKEYDRTYVPIEVTAKADDKGYVYIVIVMSVKWGHPTAFFFDGCEAYPARKDNPCYGMSPIDYRKLAHVLPQDAPKELVAHVLDTTYENRETVLYSWHDACIGNLSNKTAVFWNPESEVYVQHWVDDNFPGTKAEFRYWTPPEVPA